MCTFIQLSSQQHLYIVWPPQVQAVLSTIILATNHCLLWVVEAHVAQPTISLAVAPWTVMDAPATSH